MGFSPVTDKKIRRYDEAKEIEYVAEANNLTNRESRDYRIEFLFAHVAANFHRQVTQFATRIIDASAKFYAKNIDLFKEPITTYVGSTCGIHI